MRALLLTLQTKFEEQDEKSNDFDAEFDDAIWFSNGTEEST